MRKRMGRLLTLILSVVIIMNLGFAFSQKTVSAAEFDSTSNPDYIIQYNSGSSVCSIYEYKGSGGTVKIPETIGGLKVTSISTGAFSKKNTVVAVEIPNTVTTIQKQAFFNCSSIQRVSFGSSVRTIGDSAFGSCTRLNNVVIPSTVETLGVGAFMNCSKLSNIIISEGVREIGASCFMNCAALAYSDSNTSSPSVQFKIPNSVTQIGKEAFYSCTGLKQITLGASGYSLAIGEGAFKECTSLSKITLNNGVVSIGNEAFYKCTMSSVTIPSSVTSIGLASFFGRNFTTYSVNGGNSFKAVGGVLYSYDGKTLLSVPNRKTGTLVIQNGVVTIGDKAAYCCALLSEITLPSSVRTIGESSFETCSGAKKITIPEGPTTVGARAFKSMTGLTSPLVIPMSVTSLPTEACAQMNPSAVKFYSTTRYVNSTFSGTTNYTSMEPSACQHSYTNACDPDCNICGALRTVTHTPQTVRGKAATCTSTGLTDGTKCSVCGVTLTPQTTIAALGHVTVDDPAVAATCTTAGKTAGSHCSRCNTVITAQQTVAVLGHNPVSDSAVAATCTTAGKTAGNHCSRCNAVITAQLPIAALGHVTVNDPAVAATCTATGKTAGTHCSRCNTVLVAQTTIRALGHDFCEPCGTTCRRSGCNATRTVQAQHTWESTTCGSKCAVCGVTSGTNHVYSEVCDTTCNTCGGNRTVTVNHNYNSVCDDKCSVCKEVTRTPLHDYSGECDATCNLCGASRSVSAPHTYKHDCDVDCEVCGVRRTITHRYSNACDAYCDVCGAQRTPSAHVYDNDRDATCNVCGFKRVINTPVATPTPTPARPTATPTPAPTPAPTQAPTQQTSESGVAGFVERLYTIALGRKSDSNGKAAWINAIKNGESGAEAAKGFLFSDEFLNKGMSNSDFVATLYRTFFDREPDAAGHAAWVAALERGDSKQDVIMGFINSTEWANVCLKYGINSGGTGTANIVVEPNEQVIAFATRLYTTCLKRTPDQNGLMAWARQLANLRDTGSNAAHGFFFSDEMNNNPVSNEEFVTRLYLTFMDRQPDQGGMNAWVGQLNSGVSREEVFQGFAQSSEFGAICANYGIIR